MAHPWITRFGLIGLALMLFSVGVSAKLYRWVDDSGEVHYSDKPPAGKTVKEHKVRSGSFYSPPTGTKAAEGEEEETEEEGKPTVYKTLKITSPESGALIRTAGRIASISVSIEPALDTEQGDSLQILVDGKVISKGSATSATVSGLSPGSHSASARIRSKDGKTMKSAGSVSFRIRQPGKK